MLQRCVYVRERSAARVMEVQRDLLQRQRAGKPWNQRVTRKTFSIGTAPS
jgi:hypothetical protein